MSSEPVVRGPSAAPEGAGPVRAWAAVAVVGAVLLFALGGGWDNLRGPAAPDVEIVLPVALEPQRGELPVPPTRFRWTPGTPGSTAQLVLHRVSYETLWTSPPLLGVSELEVPASVYNGIGAGMPVIWRVREALDGKPVGSSEYVTFTFRVDNQGYGPGEAPVTYEYMD